MAERGGNAGPRSCTGTLAATAVLCLSALYLLNLGAGVVEFPSDLVPIFGNLDEFGASAALLAALRYLLRSRPVAALPPPRERR